MNKETLITLLEEIRIRPSANKINFQDPDLLLKIIEADKVRLGYQNELIGMLIDAIREDKI